MKTVTGWILIGLVLLVAWVAVAAVIGVWVGKMVRLRDRPARDRHNAARAVAPPGPTPPLPPADQRCSNPDCSDCWMRR